MHRHNVGQQACEKDELYKSTANLDQMHNQKKTAIMMYCHLQPLARVAPKYMTSEIALHQQHYTTIIRSD